MDYKKVTGVEYNIETRWENGIEHHPKSEKLMERITKIDWLFNNDRFCWKKGGDGDNGEDLMFLLEGNSSAIDAPYLAIPAGRLQEITRRRRTGHQTPGLPGVRLPALPLRRRLPHPHDRSPGGAVLHGP